jgi:hypothetical protein
MSTDRETDLQTLKDFLEEGELVQEVRIALDRCLQAMLEDAEQFPYDDARVIVQAEQERYRQAIIAVKSLADVKPKNDEFVATLRKLYKVRPDAFTPEDVRWLKRLPQLVREIRVKVEAKKGGIGTRGGRKKRRRDQCWRCETPVDSKWHEICDKCRPSNPELTGWIKCPVCGACGCEYPV